MKLYTLDIGIRTDHLMTMRLQLPETKYAQPETRRAFLRTTRGHDSRRFPAWKRWRRRRPCRRSAVADSATWKSRDGLFERLPIRR